MWWWMLTGAWALFVTVFISHTVSRPLVTPMASSPRRWGRTELAVCVAAAVTAAAVVWFVPGDRPFGPAWAWLCLWLPLWWTGGTVFARVREARTTGPSGSSHVAPVDADVDGTSSLNEMLAMSAFGAPTSVARTRFVPRFVAPTVEGAGLRWSKRLTVVAGLVAVVATVARLLSGAGYYSIDTTPDGPADVVALWGLGLVFGLVAVIGVLRHTGRTRARVAAAQANGGPVTWARVAEVHGWRRTVPGVDLKATFPVSVFKRGGIFRHRWLVTLSGYVGGWPVWVTSERGDQQKEHASTAPAAQAIGISLTRLVVVTRVVGAVGGGFPTVTVRCGTDDYEGPTLRLESETFNRTFHVEAASSRFASDLLHPRMMEHLQATLPPYAWLRVEADTVAVVTEPHVPADPWRADAMVACLVGVADRIPAHLLR